MYNENMYLSAMIALATNQLTTLRAFYPPEVAVSGEVEYRLVAEPDEIASWQTTTWQCERSHDRQACVWQVPKLDEAGLYFQYRLSETPEGIQAVVVEQEVNLDDVALEAFNSQDHFAQRAVYYSSVRTLPDEQSRFASLSFVQSSNYYYQVDDQAEASVAAVLAQDKILIQTRSSEDGITWSPWLGGWQVLEEERRGEADKLLVQLGRPNSEPVVVQLGGKMATLSGKSVSPVAPVAMGVDEEQSYEQREIRIDRSEIGLFKVGETVVVWEEMGEISYSVTAVISDLDEREGSIWIDSWQGVIPRQGVSICEGRYFCFSTEAKIAVLPEVWFDLNDEQMRRADAVSVKAIDGETIDDFTLTYGKLATPLCNDGDEQFCATGLTMAIESPPGKYLQYRLVYGDNRDVWVESVGVNVEKSGGAPGENLNWRGRLRGGKVFNGGVMRPYFWN